MLTLMQTTEGDLPYTRKIYEREKTAISRSLKFMQENHQVGELVVTRGLYDSVRIFHRTVEGSSFVEEIVDPDTNDLIETIYH